MTELINHEYKESKIVPGRCDRAVFLGTAPPPPEITDDSDYYPLTGIDVWSKCNRPESEHMEVPF